MLPNAPRPVEGRIEDAHVNMCAACRPDAARGRSWITPTRRRGRFPAVWHHATRRRVMYGTSTRPARRGWEKESTTHAECRRRRKAVEPQSPAVRPAVRRPDPKSIGCSMPAQSARPAHATSARTLSRPLPPMPRRACRRIPAAVFARRNGMRRAIRSGR